MLLFYSLIVITQRVWKVCSCDY